MHGGVEMRPIGQKNIADFTQGELARNLCVHAGEELSPGAEMLAVAFNVENFDFFNIVLETNWTSREERLWLCMIQGLGG